MILPLIILLAGPAQPVMLDVKMEPERHHVVNRAAPHGGRPRERPGVNCRTSMTQPTPGVKPLRRCNAAHAGA